MLKSKRKVFTLPVNGSKHLMLRVLSPGRDFSLGTFIILRILGIINLFFIFSNVFHMLVFTTHLESFQDSASFSYQSRVALSLTCNNTAKTVVQQIFQTVSGKSQGRSYKKNRSCTDSTLYNLFHIQLIILLPIP